MRFKLPKNNKTVLWTRHSKKKMQQYQLSAKRLKRVLRYPEREEEGVAPRTIAVMQSTGTKKHPTEIWLMYQRINNKIRIISAWRYPGKSPVREPPPIPDDIFSELSNLIKK